MKNQELMYFHWQNHSVMEKPGLDYSPRMALVLVPKQLYIEWLNALTIKELFSEESHEPSVYLLPEHYKSEDQVEDDMQNIYLSVFKNELDQFADDAISQPRDKPYEMFCEWFDVKIVLHVWELNMRGE
jgi:hypothetical protein